MDTESPIHGKPYAEATISPKRKGVFITASVAVFILVAAILYINRTTGKFVADPSKKVEPSK